MQTENKPDAEEKLKGETINVIDELSDAIKKTSRKFFNACVERTSEIVSDVFDNYLNKTKKKINKKGENNE